ncbi:hypothetical protein ACTWP4_14755 [Gracilibacillus sp. D59]|uniref:hypothetical protein n=1 Tax=Gracilibacillus sp. D59 TaxID=3457434 RepID=UPI003FCC4100
MLYKKQVYFRVLVDFKNESMDVEGDIDKLNRKIKRELRASEEEYMKLLRANSWYVMENIKR